MWLKRGAPPRRFSAVQTYVVGQLEFVWHARFPIARVGSLHVIDRLEHGQGSLDQRLLGWVPMARDRGPAVTEGQALRYLAELPWVPHALLANRAVDVRELDERNLEVAARLGDRRLALRLEFDGNGEIATASTDSRPRIEGKEAIPTRWAGSFSRYAEVGGVHIPTRAQVHWYLEDGPFKYFDAEVTGLQQIP